MAYVDQANSKNRKSAIIMVTAIHALLGYGLLVGLEYTGVIGPEKDRLESEFVEVPLPPPPPTPEMPKETADIKDPVSPPVFTPPTKLAINVDPPVLDSSTVIIPNLPLVIPKSVPSATPGTLPAASAPTFDPVGAKPRGNPGNWVTPNDYNSRWIREEMVGTAAFKVTVGTNGRAESCLITRTSGHDALDKATCDLITKRAKFDAAKNSRGEKTTGTFSSSVRWQLPD